MPDPPESNIVSADDENNRRELRKKEWGEQFDKWLIQCATKRYIVELKLATNYAGVTKDNDIISCTVLRVDKDNIQILVDNVEIWLNKLWIVGCRRVIGRNLDQPSA